MSDKLKSAWEIALEKLDAQDDTSVVKLNEAQKEKIAAIRKAYQARVAEQEIESQSRMRKAMSEGALDLVESIREELAQAKRRLEAEMEKKVDQVRSDSGSAA